MTRLRTLTAALAVTVTLLTTLATAHASSSPWRLIWQTRFGTSAPLGSFSRCTSIRAATCAGLPTVLRSQWWAYPDGWPDTATLRHLRVHGYYSPSTTVWIAHGVMNIRLWRGTGNVHSAALLPRAALNRRYGRYVETFRVASSQPGYIVAHMLRAPGTPGDGSAFEIDYPNGPGFGLPIYAFVHFPTHRPWFAAGANFNATWHTSVMEWTPAGITFYLDGRLIGHLTGRVSDVPMNWVLQNETQVLPGHAPPAANSSATLQLRYAAYYAYG